MLDAPLSQGADITKNLSTNTHTVRISGEDKMKPQDSNEAHDIYGHIGEPVLRATFKELKIELTVTPGPVTDALRQKQKQKQRRQFQKCRLYRLYCQVNGFSWTLQGHTKISLWEAINGYLWLISSLESHGASLLREEFPIQNCG